MNILIIGSGGREHALAWKIKQSSLSDQIFIAPGNAGTKEVGTNVQIGVNDFDGQKLFCIANNIDLIIVGPEDPLVNGIYDFFATQNDWKGKVFGPSKEGAQLEGSKAYSKIFMEKNNIPTAAYKEFNKDNYQEGVEYIRNHSLPIVLKADGLAAGKGVVIAATLDEALHSFEEMIIHGQFGEASSKVVIEQFLSGIEVSVFVVTDGKSYKIIGHAKDYKRIGEGDTGLNTGGMGCVTPVPFMDATFMEKVETKIIQPTVHGLEEANINYTGFIFFGLINVDGEPFVIEYNCRMGDPETEVVMPRLQSDLLEILNASFDGTLANIPINYNSDFFTTVVAVSGGYPGDYEKGKIITIPSSENSIIFHAGTKEENNGDILTNGGRVIAVTSEGMSIKEAVSTSLETLSKISFEGITYRKDIGYEFE